MSFFVSSLFVPDAERAIVLAWRSYSDQQELVFSLHKLHNAVNRDLNKPEKTLDCCQKSYVPEVSLTFWVLIFILLLIVFSITLISYLGGKCGNSLAKKYKIFHMIM